MIRLISSVILLCSINSFAELKGVETIELPPDALIYSSQLAEQMAQSGQGKILKGWNTSGNVTAEHFNSLKPWFFFFR